MNSLPPLPKLRSLCLSCLASVVTAFLTACQAPIGADKTSTREAYAQVDATALSTGKPSPDTVSLLHRYDLDQLAAQAPDVAVVQLHQKALAPGERNLLFALAAMSYVARDPLPRGGEPLDPR